MISSYIIRSQRTSAPSRPDASTRAEAREFSRLIGAAVVSRAFCQLLLDDPRAAIKHGYAQERFLFTTEELDFLASIHALSLEEFAAQVVRGLQVRSAEGCFPIQAVGSLHPAGSLPAFS